MKIGVYEIFENNSNSYEIMVYDYHDKIAFFDCDFPSEYMIDIKSISALQKIHEGKIQFEVSDNKIKIIYHEETPSQQIRIYKKIQEISCDDMEYAHKDFKELFPEYII